MIGIHDGSADGVMSYAAIINREMFYTFILSCTANLTRTLWPNEKKEAGHIEVLNALEELK